MAISRKVTVAIPSFNQAAYLEAALESVFAQDVAVEVYVADGGSQDGSVDIIRKWESRLLGWRSSPDAGQSAAINEAIARGEAPYVCWLNSDDWLLPGGLARLIEGLELHPEAPMSYGRIWNYDEKTRGLRRNFEVRPFSERLMAQFCLIAQPGTLIRRSAWNAVAGVDESLHMAMDYDLWWKLFRAFGTPQFVDEYVAVNRRHGLSKTSTKRRLHYREAMGVVRKHHGRVPLKWWLAQPYMVWYRALLGR